MNETAPRPAAVKYFADPTANDETTDQRGFLARIAELVSLPMAYTRPVAVSVDGKPCLAELVNPLTWRLTYHRADGGLGRRFVQTTNPDKLAIEALRIAADLAADLGVGFSNVVALATV